MRHSIGGAKHNNSSHTYRGQAQNFNPASQHAPAGINNNLQSLLNLLQQLLQQLTWTNANNNSPTQTPVPTSTGTAPTPTPAAPTPGQTGSGTTTPATPAPVSGTTQGPVTTPAPTGSTAPIQPEINGGNAFGGTASTGAAIGIIGPGFGFNGPTNTDYTKTTPNTPVTLDVLANDPATTANTRLTSFTNPQNGTLAIVDNKLVYTPNPGFEGTDSFQYLTNEGYRGSASTWVGNGTPTLRPPSEYYFGQSGTAVSDYANAVSGDPVRIEVLANDFTGNNNLQIQNISQPKNGTVTQDGNALVYTSNPGFAGPDQFSYDTGTGRANVDIFVQTPRTNPDWAYTEPGTPVEINVIANDAIPAGQQGINRFTQGQHGSVSQNGNQLTYTPDAGFSGADTFSYQGANGQTAEVNVQVGNVNFPGPIFGQTESNAGLQQAVTDLVATPVNTSARVDVLRNDYDSGAGNIQAFSQAQNGTVTQDGNTLVYTPNQNFQGYDNFSYSREDGSKAVVSLAVGDTTNRPVAIPIGITPTPVPVPAPPPVPAPAPAPTPAPTVVLNR